MSYLDEIDDPRKPSNGTLHDFREILVILIAAVLSDCDTVEDITFWPEFDSSKAHFRPTPSNGAGFRATGRQKPRYTGC